MNGKSDLVTGYQISIQTKSKMRANQAGVREIRKCAKANLNDWAVPIIIRN